MTLDEAIYHAREVAEKNYEVGMLCHANPDDEELDVYCECAKDHLQLAEWLEDYKRLKLLEEENQFTTYNSSENETEEVYEKTKSCENCRHDDKGTDEYPCVECCKRYLLKFEPKPKRPEMKTCPCCGGRVGIVKHDDGERSCKFCKYGDIGEDEYPCIECTERYSNQFEPKPKEPKLKTCPFCGNRWEWRR